MKKHPTAIVILVLILLAGFTAPASAFLCTPSEETEMYLSALQEMNTSYQETTLRLSDDIGQMADRIVYTEELIGQMADRIVTTEAMLAQLTLMLAQIASGQEIDPALLQSIQASINACSQTTP